MTASNIFSFNDNEYNQTISPDKIKPFLFSTVALVSSFTFNINNQHTNYTVFSNNHSIRAEQKSFSSDENMSNHQLFTESGMGPLNKTKNIDLTELVKEELDMEELERLRNSFDDFSNKQQDKNEKFIENFATLKTQMQLINDNLEKLNKELPSNIRDEIKKIQIEKKEKNTSVWIAPVITGIVIVIAQFFVQFIANLMS